MASRQFGNRNLSLVCLTFVDSLDLLFFLLTHASHFPPSALSVLALCSIAVPAIEVYRVSADPFS
jgi:hypothetical protein